MYRYHFGLEYPRSDYRNIIYPVARQVDDIVKMADYRWLKLAQSRGGIRKLQEFYTQH